MQLVDMEHIFGGERVVVYYLAESRVDFRELVRLLAGEFQTRIEMRQIGVRDEAKLLADYGDCGYAGLLQHPLVGMPPVSMKMAKLQKATLDPTKISGPVRPVEVLPPLRVRDLRAQGSRGGTTCRRTRPPEARGKPGNEEHLRGTP